MTDLSITSSLLIRRTLRPIANRSLAYFLANIVIGVLLVPYFINILRVATYRIIPLETSIAGYVAIRRPDPQHRHHSSLFPGFYLQPGERSRNFRSYHAVSQREMLRPALDRFLGGLWRRYGARTFRQDF